MRRRRDSVAKTQSRIRSAKERLRQSQVQSQVQQSQLQQSQVQHRQVQLPVSVENPDETWNSGPPSQTGNTIINVHCDPQRRRDFGTCCPVYDSLGYPYFPVTSFVSCSPFLAGYPNPFFAPPCGPTAPFGPLYPGPFSNINLPPI